MDHLVARVLDTGAVTFPDPPIRTSPFVHFRSLLHSYHRAIASGLTDGEYVDLVERLDRDVGAIGGVGFVRTPFWRDADLSTHLGFSPTGGVWVKDETGNVGGSHKGRHLMGVLLHLEVAHRLRSVGDVRGVIARPALAIASCGNAALAAALLARAARLRLQVFVPPDADTGVIDRLAALGAEVTRCPRQPGDVGDPCVGRLADAVAGGALPFTCQGPQNGLVIEGGETLAWEIASDLAAEGRRADHLVVQVGGGALASACVQGLDEAVALGAIGSAPAIHTVQTQGAHPLERAYERVRALVGDDRTPAAIAAALAAAARHRSDFMWPWESEPRSAATGILDDETYDWRAVVGGMLATGGQPLVVREARLAEASSLAVRSGYQADVTGSAGIAGLLDLIAMGVVGPDDVAVVLLTGARR